MDKTEFSSTAKKKNKHCPIGKKNKSPDKTYGKSEIWADRTTKCDIWRPLRVSDNTTEMLEQHKTRARLFKASLA